MKNSHAWFSNKECRYYPCHKLEEMNCLFCFCPLYWFPDCGGDYTRTAKGVKNCSRCIRPHQAGGYDDLLAEVSSRLPDGSRRQRAEKEE